MCGIAGIARTGGAPCPKRRVEPLTRLLAHRGPDDFGHAALGPVCFGHRRLSVLGVAEPEARQPVSDDRYMLSFNGEIYNFQALATELTCRGIANRGRSDTEILFLLLKHFGLDATLAKLDGMFAFAWFDRQSGRLCLVRDRLGEKPLYWARAGDDIVFGSEMKVILAHPDFQRRVAVQNLPEYLHNLRVLGEETLFEGLYEIEPGTIREFDIAAGASTVRRYWRVEDTIEDQSSDVAVEDVVAEFSERRRRAVTSRMVSDVPIGILLSGGVDSASILDSMVCEASDMPLGAYSALMQSDETCEVFPGRPSYNERSAIEAILGHCRGNNAQNAITHRTVTLGLAEYLDAFVESIWHHDEPPGNTMEPYLLTLCRRARDDGVKVLQSGNGMDEILFGYDRFHRGVRNLQGIRDPSVIANEVYFGGGLENAALVDALCNVTDGVPRTSAWQWLSGAVDRYSVAELLILFRQKYVLQVLLHRDDRAGMGAGVEVRLPYLQPDFVAWANSLPLSVKADATTGESKLLLRAELSARLPEAVSGRIKQPSLNDLDRWIIVGDSRLQLVFRDLTSDVDSFSANFLDTALVADIANKHFAGENNYYILIQAILSLELWYRQYFWNSDVAAGPIDIGFDVGSMARHAP